MLPQPAGIAEAEVEIVAAFGIDVDVAHLKVFIAKHFLNRGQAACVFVGELCLHSVNDEHRSGSTISPEAYTVRVLHIVLHSLAGGNGT